MSINLWENQLFSIEERWTHANAEIISRGQQLESLRAEIARLTDREQKLRDNKRQTETDASDRINALRAEVEALTHDIKEYVQIASEQANRIAELERQNSALQSQAGTPTVEEVRIIFDKKES